MNWWRIRIDPVPLPQRLAARLADAGGVGGRSYRLCLPLIPDGRISLPLFRAEPLRATVTSLHADQASCAGRIELRDHQWFCAWSPEPEPELMDLRIIGTSFALDQVIGLRPRRGVIELFRVCERTVLI